MKRGEPTNGVMLSDAHTGQLASVLLGEVNEPADGFERHRVGDDSATSAKGSVGSIDHILIAEPATDEDGIGALVESGDGRTRIA